MQGLKRRIAAWPFLGRILLAGYRFRLGVAHLRAPVVNLFRWLVTSREVTNFTYDLEATNKRHLGSLLADVTGESFERIMGYIEEAERDAPLRAHLNESIARSGLAFMADDDMRFGRRLGWYALVRILKPTTVVETGVDKGLGSCLLAAALARNQQEGHEGRYYGTDIDPDAGYLLSGDYAGFGEILYGDSLASLRGLDRTIDLFINDSDHSAAYEAEEYRTVAGKLSPQAVVLSDNAHRSDALLEFSLQAGRQFVYFQEKPENHWYRGAGIGISFVR